MSCVPVSPSTFDNGPREYLHRLVQLISSLRGGQSRYLPMLQTKMSEVMPNFQLRMQQSLFQQSLSSTRSELSRLDLYGDPSVSSSTPVSESSPYGTPPVVRQGGGSSGGSLHTLQYQDPNLAMTSHLGGPSGYPSFSTAVAFPEGATTSALGGQGMFQTHLQHGGGFSG
jgi:hypothetical protein